jgi:hypothetical protein
VINFETAFTSLSSSVFNNRYNISASLCSFVPGNIGAATQIAFAKSSGFIKPSTVNP